MLWRQIQRNNFTSWEKLAKYLELDPKACSVKTHFSLNLPLRLAAKIKKGCWDDPILRQFLPTHAELIKSKHFCSDPVGDNSARKEAKLLHKYHGRALLLATGACAMHCRYCFRQHFDYAANLKGFELEIKRIQEDTSLSEIILSGGDPLSLSNKDLHNLIEQLDAIKHLKRLRFHTRFPIGIPERIDPEFLQILQMSRLQIFFVVHCNHPNEWDDEIASALKQVQKLGIPLLCSSVLLKGINDDVETLQKLCEVLVDHGVMPYYLNQLDQVEGAMHFEVEQTKGLALIQELSTRLSGYAVPTYVREIAGEKNKTRLCT